jgi:alpha-ketoglutarate-dependent taurine dioxygenase
MRIPPTAVHDAEISGPGAWTQADFLDPSAWLHHFREDTLREIDNLLSTSPSQENLQLPSFDADCARLRDELARGRGFTVLRGIPVDRYSEEQLSSLYWRLGALFGRQLPQNVRADRLYDVRDEGYDISRDYGRVGVRFSKTTEALQFHTDSAPALMGNTPDVIGLFALQVARSGGHTALVSAHTLHNILRRERPDYLRRLYQPYHFDRSVEWCEGEPRTLVAPVFSYTDSLQVRYFRHYIPKGHELAGIPLTGEDLAPLDYMDTVANRPELQVTFAMRRGDVQLVSNTFVLHSRTNYQDWPEPERKRHLKRLWIQFT